MDELNLIVEQTTVVQPLYVIYVQFSAFTTCHLDNLQQHTFTLLHFLVGLEALFL